METLGATFFGIYFLWSKTNFKLSLHNHVYLEMEIKIVSTFFIPNIFNFVKNEFRGRRRKVLKKRPVQRTPNALEVSNDIESMP